LKTEETKIKKYRQFDSFVDQNMCEFDADLSITDFFGESKTF